MKEKLKPPKELKEKRGKDEQIGPYYGLKISTTLKFQRESSTSVLPFRPKHAKECKLFVDLPRFFKRKLLKKIQRQLSSNHTDKFVRFSP